MKKSFTIALAALAFAACKPRAGEAPAINQNAIKALGGTVPANQFDRNFWQREHDTNSSTWREAKRLCGHTVLADYPNCLPVNDILQVDQRKRAEEGERAAAKNDEMGRRGFGYDYSRQAWLPFRDMQIAGCVIAYPRVGEMTWQCPPSATIPKGIPDPNFSKEGR